METETSVITIEKKAFIEPAVRKRSRPVSPEDKSLSVKTSNSFSVLGEENLEKRKAISSRSSSEERLGMSSADRPKAHKSRSTEKNKDESEMFITSSNLKVPVGTSNLKVPVGTGVKPKIVKQNISHIPSKKTSQPKDGKAGKIQR